MLLNLIISVLCAQNIFAQELSSSCPDFFTYNVTKSIEGRWFGDIILRSEYILAGYWLEIGLSNNVEVLGLKSNQSMTTQDNKNYLYINTIERLEPGKTKKFPLFVKYDVLNYPVPEIETIFLNGRQLCPKQLPSPVGMSPCPGIFSFEPDQPEPRGKWFGRFNLNLEYNVKGVYIEFHLNGKADLVETSKFQVKEINNQETEYLSSFGDVSTSDKKIYLISNSSFILPYGYVLSIPFTVTYDVLSGMPHIKTVILNGRVICQGSSKVLPVLPQIPLIDSTKQIMFPARVQTPETPASPETPEPVAIVTPIPSLNTATSQSIPMTEIYDFEYEEDSDSNQQGYQCGLKEISDKIIFGTTTSIQNHPWHGAIFRGEAYICGMSLISKKFALSAAHCFYEQSRLPANKNSFIFRFGLDNLQNRFNHQVQIGRLSQLFVHPDYHYHTAKYDIAMVEFFNHLRVTEFVIPVCLWSGSVHRHEIENKTGVIVGFGQTESGSTSDSLREATIQVVGSEVCREADNHFYAEYLSINSFCAGNISSETDKTSTPCTGDSGGGMFIKRPNTEIWEIRGIISTGKPSDDRTTCVPWVYTIFTDVAVFKDWITEKLLK